MRWSGRYSSLRTWTPCWKCIPLWTRLWRRSAKSEFAPTADLRKKFFPEGAKFALLLFVFASMGRTDRPCRPSGLLPHPPRKSVFALKTVAAFSIDSHGFGYLQKCPGGVRQVRVFAID